MESRIKGKEFGFKEVVRSTIEVCHSNYAEFFKLNALILIISMIANTMNIMIPMYLINPVAILLAYLGAIVVAVVSFYFTVRLSIVQFYNVHDHIHYVENGFSDKYKKAGGIIWRYIGASLLIGLIIFAVYMVFAITGVIVGVIGSIIGFNAVTVGIIVVISVLAIGCIVYVLVKFYMALMVRIFDTENQNYFKESFELVKGKFFSLLGIYTLAILVQLPIIGVAVYLMIIGTINQFVYMGGIMATSLFITPYFSCGFVVIYLLLKEDKDEKEMLQVIEEVL